MRMSWAKSNRFNGVCVFFWIGSFIVLFVVSCSSVPMTADERAKEATKYAYAGRDAFSRGDIDSALSNFEKALQLVPGWGKVMKSYAEVLYQKALTYDEQSHRTWQKTFGREFDEITRAWKSAELSLSEEEKAKLSENSSEARKTAIFYYRKSFDQLQLLDKMMGSADPDVVCAMGIIHIFLNEFDSAIACFERALDNPIVENKKVRDALLSIIQAIRDYQKQQSTTRP